MRQVHRAGEKLFVDFPGDTVPVCDRAHRRGGPAGRAVRRRRGRVELPVRRGVPVPGAAVLGDRARALLRGLGGCPAIVVCDNLRSGVTRPHRYEPDVNATYAEMAAHYGVAVIPARAYKPRDKAKAESGVLLAERWIIARLRDRRFYSRRPRRTPRSPGASPRSTPGRSRSWTAAGSCCSSSWTARRCGRCRPTRYEFATWRKARVNIDYHIEADRHYYSVPYQLVGQQVDVRLSAATVEIFRSSAAGGLPRALACAARAHHRPGAHARVPPAARRVDAVADHRLGRQDRPGHRRAWSQAILASRPHPEQGYRSALGIIRLAGRYGSPGRGRLRPCPAPALLLLPQRRVDPAHRPGPPAAARRTPRPCPAPRHDNLRGPGYYH